VKLVVYTFFCIGVSLGCNIPDPSPTVTVTVTVSPSVSVSVSPSSSPTPSPSQEDSPSPSPSPSVSSSCTPIKITNGGACYPSGNNWLCDIQYQPGPYGGYSSGKLINPSIGSTAFTTCDLQPTCPIPSPNPSASCAPVSIIGLNQKCNITMTNVDWVCNVPYAQITGTYTPFPMPTVSPTFAAVKIGDTTWWLEGTPNANGVGAMQTGWVLNPHVGDTQHTTCDLNPTFQCAQPNPSPSVWQPPKPSPSPSPSRSP